MIKRLVKAAAFVALCGIWLATLGRAQALPRFPALELRLGENKTHFNVIAQEVSLRDDLAYSSSYSSRRGKFVVPSFFTFSLRGYHSETAWKPITSLNFKFGSQTFSGKTTYKVDGPERVRTLDSRDSNYVETLSVRLPFGIVRQIVANKGVLISTTPSNFRVSLTAAQLDGVKQLVGSVTEFSKVTVSPSSGKGKGIAPGLPLRRVANKELHVTMLETAISQINERFQIQAMAATHYQGQKLAEPQVAFLVLVMNEEPIWANINSLVLSFGGKKLRLPSSARSAKEFNGISVEVMTATVPYRDFVRMAKGGKFRVGVGNGSFEVTQHQATGIRELANRISK